MLLIAFIIQLSLSLIVITALTLSKKSTLLGETWKAIGAAVFMVGLWLVGVWVWPSHYGYLVLLSTLIFVIVYRIKRSQRAPEKQFSLPRHLPTISSGVLGVAMMFFGIKGQLAPSGPFIDLASPLPINEGNCVLSGGSSLALNLHYIVGPNGATNEEIHAIDFTKMNKGFRTINSQLINPKPIAPESYAVFDVEIYAPCDGVVVGLETQKRDLPAGNRFRDKTGSNHVTLNCSGTLVVLAHMKHQSSKITIGSNIKTGDTIGRVGNTGNTEEPHLHIHAAKRLNENSDNEKLVPVPMLFNGRYLSRRDCL